MTTFTKLLPPEAAPAQPILARAKQLVLTSAQRMAWEDSFETPEGVIAVSVEEKRPLFVNDVFVDDAGQFWVVRPAVEKVLHVTGCRRPSAPSSTAASKWPKLPRASPFGRSRTSPRCSA